jgi:hypothetical protein
VSPLTKVRYPYEGITINIKHQARARSDTASHNSRSRLGYRGDRGISSVSAAKYHILPINAGREQTSLTAKAVDKTFPRLERERRPDRALDMGMQTCSFPEWYVRTILGHCAEAGAMCMISKLYFGLTWAKPMSKLTQLEWASVDHQNGANPAPSDFGRGPGGVAYVASGKLWD